MYQYTIVTTPIGNHQIVERTAPDGTVTWIPMDPSNADYQQYLADTAA